MLNMHAFISKLMNVNVNAFVFKINVPNTACSLFIKKYWNINTQLNIQQDKIRKLLYSKYK